MNYYFLFDIIMRLLFILKYKKVKL